MGGGTPEPSIGRLTKSGDLLLNVTRIFLYKEPRAQLRETGVTSTLLVNLWGRKHTDRSCDLPLIVEMRKN